MQTPRYQIETITEDPTLVQSAHVVRAKFGSVAHGALGLTLQLASAQGTVLAVLTDMKAVFSLLSEFGAERPEELQGKMVLAHFSARRLVGITPA